MFVNGRMVAVIAAKVQTSGGTGRSERFNKKQYGVKATRMHAIAEQITERYFFDSGTVQGRQEVKQERNGR